MPSRLIYRKYLKRIYGKRGIQNSLHGVYKKWLQYYPDFCLKYHFLPIHKESLPHFINKLQEKQQTKVQQEQAAMAITLYYEILDVKELNGHC